MNNIYGDILMNFESRDEWYLPNLCCRYSNSTSKPQSQMLESQGIYKAVIDSGASHHMSNVASAFESITKFSPNHPYPQALMGDDKTSLDIV
jgi:hypothetical protein